MSVTSSVEGLKKRADFLATQKDGQKWVGKTLIVHALKTPGPQVRLGLTVTKKIFPRAVDRNRVRRRLRALALSILSTQAVARHDYVIIGRDDALKAPSDLLRKELLWCLKRLNLLREDS